MFIALQNVVIISLIFNYKNQRILIAVFAPVYSILAWYLTSDLASMELLSTLQTAVIPLMILSRVSRHCTLPYKGNHPRRFYCTFPYSRVTWGEWGNPI